MEIKPGERALKRAFAEHCAMSPLSCESGYLAQFPIYQHLEELLFNRGELRGNFVVAHLRVVSNCHGQGLFDAPSFLHEVAPTRETEGPMIQPLKSFESRSRCVVYVPVIAGRRAFHLRPCRPLQMFSFDGIEALCQVIEARVLQYPNHSACGQQGLSLEVFQAMVDFLSLKESNHFL